MPVPFVYRERSQAAINARANKQGGDFQGYIKDEFKIYKVRDGENCIRILPASWESDHYGLDVHVHWGVGPENATVLCLRKMLQERCPVCEEVTTLERAGETKEAQELSERLSVLAWIIDRKDEAAGPQLWAMPFTKVDREIQKQSQDRQSGVYFVVDNPDTGYDIYFDKSGKGLTTQYTGVQLARNPTSVDQEFLDYIAQVPVPETLIWRDYDTLKNLMYGGVPPADAAPASRFTGNGQVGAPTAPAARPVTPGAPPRRIATPPVAAARPVAPPPRRVATPAAPPPMQRPVPRAAPPVVEEQYDPDPAYEDPNAVYEDVQYEEPPFDPAPEPAPPPRQVRPARPMAPPPSGNVPAADRAADIRAKFGRH